MHRCCWTYAPRHGRGHGSDLSPSGYASMASWRLSARLGCAPYRTWITARHWTTFCGGRPKHLSVGAQNMSAAFVFSYSLHGRLSPSWMRHRNLGPCLMRSMTLEKNSNGNRSAWHHWQELLLDSDREFISWAKVT